MEDEEVKNSYGKFDAGSYFRIIIFFNSHVYFADHYIEITYTRQRLRTQ
jgi:hypothetical protein